MMASFHFDNMSEQAAKFINDTKKLALALEIDSRHVPNATNVRQFNLLALLRCKAYKEVADTLSTKFLVRS